jgi:hypothetical protein
MAVTPEASRTAPAHQAHSVAEHRVAIPDEQEQIEATDGRGRRWYHFRPQPRCRADVMGFNYTWWAAVLLLVVVLLPW